MGEQRRAARLNSALIATPSILLYEPPSLLQAPAAPARRRSECGASVPHRPAMHIPAIARAFDHKKSATVRGGIACTEA
jgi:hypothetical protein